MTRQRSDPLGAALVREIRACCSAPLTVDLCEFDPWMSATFVGAVHRLVLAFEGDAAPVERLAAILPDHDFALRGHIVADVAARVAAEEGAVRLRLEILTVEE